MSDADADAAAEGLDDGPFEQQQVQDWEQAHEQQLLQAETPVQEHDQQVVRNRGTLAAAAQLRQQAELTPQQQLVDEWHSFASRQAQRYVPAPPNPNRRYTQQSACYRLRVLHVDGLPPPQLSSGTLYGLQLGVSLYDEAVGQCYGSTCYSMVEPLQQQQQQLTDAEGSSSAFLDFAFDALFHTAISDPHCMAVVELILVEMEEDGAHRTKCSAGWAQLPLFMRNNGGAAGRASSQTPAVAPVLSGTPRYLQLRSVCGDQMPPPVVLGSCMVAYQVEAFPAMQPAIPLLPQDFLVTYTDVIPGLGRFDFDGQATTALKRTLNTLASPQLAAPCALSLGGVQLVVPQLLHNLLSVLPQVLGTIPPPELVSLLAVPCQPAAVAYSLRLRVHNGRTFVGPWLSTQLQVQPHIGSLVLVPTAAGQQQLVVDWLLQDRLMVLVLELLAAPTTVSQAGADSSGTAVDAVVGGDGSAAPAPVAPPAAGSAATVGEVLVGRSVLAPFAAVAADGSAATLDAGRHKLCIDSSSCMGSLISSGSCWAPKSCSSSMLAAGCEPGDLLLPLNWRAMLGDAAVRAVPDPTVTLDLQACSASPRLPQTATAAAAAAAAAATVECQNTAASVLPPEAAAEAQPVASDAGAPVTVPPAQPPPQDVLDSAATDAVVADLPVTTCVREHESPAARSLKLAAQHLEEAASIPVKTPHGSTSGSRQSQDAADTASRQQLQQLADAMQQQLDMLALAVAELKQERQTLRSSLTMLESAAASSAAAQDAYQQQQHPEYNSPSVAAAHPPPSLQQHNYNQQGSRGPEHGWLAAVPEAVDGAVGCQAVQQQYYTSSLTPSRAVLQQLHEAGMAHALPADIQAVLQQQQFSSLSLHQQGHIQQQQQQQQQQHTSSRPAALLLDVERRDPRTASDVVLQLLAFRPNGSGPPPAAAAALGQLPSSLKCVYFTLQFFKSGPVTTDTCMLAVASAQPQPQQPQQQQHVVQPQPDTFILLPQQQQQGANTPAAGGGAGVLMKFCVDGSRPSELLPGQDAQGAVAAYLEFCRYLATNKLAVDMWDGDSLLQVGSCCVDLSGLLRQGRDLTDQLLELPLFKDFSSHQSGSSSGMMGAAAAAGGGDGGQGCVQQAQQQQQTVGTLVLRLINVGRQPSGGSITAEVVASAAPTTPVKKVIRAVPLEPGSPVAKELRGASGSGGSPFAVDWSQHHQQQQQYQVSGAGGTGGGDGMKGGPDGAVSGSTDATAADIISFEQRKVAREQQLRELLHSPGSSPKRTTPGSSSPGAVHWQQQQHPGVRQQSPAGKLSLAAGGTWGSPSPTKRTQQQQQQWRPGSPLSTLAAGSEGGGNGGYGAASEPYKALQQQLLSDVDAVRKRQKPGFIRSQLRKSLVTQCTLRPSPGHPLLLEHTLANSIGRDAVFELRVSHPHELAAVESLQELRDLQQSVVGGSVVSTAAGCVAGSCGGGAQGVGGSPRQQQQPQLRQLVQQAVATGGAGGGRELARGGRIFLAAHESVVIPFRLALNQPGQDSAAVNGQQPPPQHCEQQQPHTLTVEFVPLGLDWPVSILELTIQPEPPIVDRTLRYHCPERELLHVELLLAQLPGVSAAVLAAAAGGRLVVAASRADVGVTVVSKQQQKGQQQQDVVCLRYRCGAASQAAAVQFYVWLYGDPAAAQPLEAWQVCVHALQRVDMRATVGQHSSTTLAIAGGSVDRLVAVYSSQPAELQPTPASLQMPGGGLAALGLVYKPRSPGQQQVCVNLVDVNTRRLVHALIVCTDAALPPLHRQLEVTVHAGSVSQHQLEVQNATNRPASYVATSSTPWLLSINGPTVLQVKAGGKGAFNLSCDACSLASGARASGLVFVNDAQHHQQHMQSLHEECVVVSVVVV